MFGKVRFLIPRGREAGRSYLFRTDTELQAGPAPERIDRPMLLSLGYTGHRVNSFPMTGGLQYIGHVPLAQVRRGPTMQPGNAVDNSAAIPAVYAGNPVE